MKTKKYFIPLVLCLLLVGVGIFFAALPNRPDGTIDTMELDEVANFSETELENRLIGEIRQEITNSWGIPHSELDAQDAVAYELPNNGKYKKITLFFENDVIVDIVVK